MPSNDYRPGSSHTGWNRAQNRGGRVVAMDNLGLAPLEAAMNARDASPDPRRTMQNHFKPIAAKFFAQRTYVVEAVYGRIVSLLTLPTA